jgi:CMP-N-acetylneuraminic acid synthetase
MSSEKILALINARGGSKGVPGKNKKPLLGKPLITYSIEAGQQSQLIDKILVSTDDEEIAQIAKDAGADVPFLRPAELATDTASQFDVIKHAVEFLEEQGEHYDIICILQPTCPLRSAEDIDSTINLLKETGSDSAITIGELYDKHPAVVYEMEGENMITPYIKVDKSGTRRQEFKPLYYRAGTVYVMRRKCIFEDNNLYGDSTCGHLVPDERCFNIDSPFDWQLCEAYMKSLL